MKWKNIRSSTLVLMAVIVISKLIGLLRDIFLANYFGTSSVSDAYLIAISVPTLLFYFIGHALSTAYLPMYNKVRHEKGDEAAEHYSNNLMCISLGIATLIVVLLVVFPQTVIKIFAAGFDAETAGLAAKFIRTGAVSLYCMVIVNIWSGYLQARGNYLIPAAVSLPRNAVIIVSIVIASCTHLAVLGLGILFAYIAEFIFLLPFALRNGYRIRPRIDWSDRDIRETLYLVLPILLGVAVSQINKIVDKSIASTITAGGISALSYASVINNAVQEVAVTGIITVLFADCSALAAAGEHQKVKERLTKTVDTMVFLLLPMSIGIIILAEPIVSLFFLRGNFDFESVALTASALRCYTAGLAFLAVRDTFVKVFYAYKNTKVTTASSIAAIILNIILNFLLSRFLGVSGLAAATSIAAVAQCIFLCVYFHRKQLSLDAKKIMTHVVFSVFASAVMAALVYGLYHFLLPDSMGQGIRVCVSVVVGAVVYIVISGVINRHRIADIFRTIIK